MEETISTKNRCVKRYSTLGENPVPYYEYTRPEKCQRVSEDGIECGKYEHILYPFEGKKFCFFCWSKAKFYDNKRIERGESSFIKKNVFFSKAEKYFEEKKITDLEWNDFKTLYASNKKKARRFIKKLFKIKGLK